MAEEIIAPFGSPVKDRPPIPTEEERVAKWRGKREAKAERRRNRRKVEAGVAEEGDGKVGEGNDGGKLEAMRKKGRENDEQAELLQKRMDQVGLDAERVEKRVEGARL